MRDSRRVFRTVTAGLAAAMAVLFVACGNKKETVKVTNAAAETQQSAAEQKSSDAKLSPAPGESSGAEESAGSDKSSAGVKKLSSELQKYEKNQISIAYPVISGMKDSAQQEKLNAHLKENALAVLSNYPDSREAVNQEKDSLKVSCKLISADASRVIAVYTGEYMMDGAAHPSRLFYTNTVDVKTISDVSLRDAADPYTMAAYALAEDVQLKDADEETLRAYREQQKTMSVEQYQTCLERGDFPLKKGADGTTVTWPDSFSYAADGALYFSVPVPHAMGDYVIVEYDISTK